MPDFSRYLLPTPVREFTGQRWLNIVLRCAHLTGIAGIAAGFLFGLDQALWLPYWYLTIGSGIALTMLYLWSSLLWLFQVKGLVVIVKLLLLGAAITQPVLRAELFILIIVISGISAHAPGRVRGFRWLPARKEKSL